MSRAKINQPPMDTVLGFLKRTRGLKAKVSESGRVEVVQTLDKKSYCFHSLELLEILPRIDSDGRDFLQVNFKSGSKVLLTENLIGFKPVEIVGLDMTRLPRVVTTPDLQSVFKALNDSLDSELVPSHDLEILKKVYQSILFGAERVGFDLEEERKWIHRLIASRPRASA